MAEGADHPLARTAEKSYKIEMTDFFFIQFEERKTLVHWAVFNSKCCLK